MARLKPYLAGLALAGMLPLVAACGFTPLYAQPEVGGPAGGLSRIAVEVPQNRTGYLLREALDDALALDRSQPAQYRLVVRFEERLRGRGLNVDDTPSRLETRLDVAYALIEIGTGKVVLQRTKPVFVSADATNQPYASITAQQDSQARAAAEAAAMIRTDVALAFSGQ